MSNWIETVPSQHDPAPDFPSIQVMFEDKGDESLKIHIDDFDAPNPVAGLLTAIEYCDGDSVDTRRRITMMRLTLHWNVPTLYAVCHEANGLRGFRVDRIQNFITADGELFTATEFWSSLDIDPVSVANGHVKPKRRQIESLVGPQICILAALSRSDGNMRKSEIDAIVDYIEIELEDAGVFMDASETPCLINYIRRIRPTRETVQQAVDTIFGGHFSNRKRLVGRSADKFMKAAGNVIDADGIFHDAEFQFISELRANR